MTRILVTKWLWRIPYSVEDMAETEKYDERYVIATGNIFEGKHID